MPENKTHKAWHGYGDDLGSSTPLKWQHDREFLDNEKFLETKAALQRIQMFLVVKGVI